MSMRVVLLELKRVVRVRFVRHYPLRWIRNNLIALRPILAGAVTLGMGARVDAHRGRERKRKCVLVRPVIATFPALEADRASLHVARWNRRTPNERHRQHEAIPFRRFRNRDRHRRQYLRGRSDKVTTPRRR
jgi:hypothetical protein